MPPPAAGVITVPLSGSRHGSVAGPELTQPVRPEPVSTCHQVKLTAWTGPLWMVTIWPGPSLPTCLPVVPALSRTLIPPTASTRAGWPVASPPVAMAGVGVVVDALVGATVVVAEVG